MSSQILIISKHRDSTIFLGNLFQYLSTITVLNNNWTVFSFLKAFHLDVILCISVCTHCCHSCQWKEFHSHFISHVKHSPLSPIRYLNTLKRFSQAFPSFLGWTMPALSYDRWPSFLIISVALHWTRFSVSMGPLYWGAQTRTQHSRNGLTNIEYSCTS